MARRQILIFSVLAGFASAQFMTKTEDYNINLTPNEAMDIDEPMPVNIDIYLDDIFSIETTGTLITRVRLVERWVDPRLSISGERSDVRVEVVEPIWHPEGRFKHNADTHTKWDVTYLVNKGQVVKITEMTLNIYCQFDFTWFPWDWQECALIYYDATYGEDQVMFKTGNYKIHSEVNLPQWEIIKEIYEEMLTETDSGPSAAAVNANFVIQRQISFYRDFIFLPSIFLVLISYCSFFVDHKVIPGRVVLGIIPMLTAFAQLGNTMRTLPRFSYNSWISTFLFAHTIFPIVTMFEFTLISFLEWRVVHAAETALSTKPSIRTPTIELLAKTKKVEAKKEARPNPMMGLLAKPKKEEAKKEDLLNPMVGLLAKPKKEEAKKEALPTPMIGFLAKPKKEEAKEEVAYEEVKLVEKDESPRPRLQRPKTQTIPEDRFGKCV